MLFVFSAKEIQGKFTVYSLTDGHRRYIIERKKRDTRLSFA